VFSAETTVPQWPSLCIDIRLLSCVCLRTLSLRRPRYDNPCAIDISNLTDILSPDRYTEPSVKEPNYYLSLNFPPRTDIDTTGLWNLDTGPGPQTLTRTIHTRAEKKKRNKISTAKYTFHTFALATPVELSSPGSVAHCYTQRFTIYCISTMIPTTIMVPVSVSIR
jgi:hypothetical protein